MAKKEEFMDKRSLWSDVKLPSYEALSGDTRTDVLIIGGGICGVLCAYSLMESGIECALIEKGRVLSGVTGNTTAKITAQHGLIYERLREKYGKRTAQVYYKAQSAAVGKLRELCGACDCDYEEKTNFVYSRDNYYILAKEYDILSEIGADPVFSEKPDLPFATVGAVGLASQGCFHPIKLLSRLLSGIKIYENTKATSLDGDTVITDKGKIKAEKIIVATHFPFIDKYGLYFMKLYQHRSYVLALDGAKIPDGMYIDENENGLSFRGYKNFLLLGGGSHRTGSDGGGYRELLDFAERAYHGARVECGFATQDCMSLDGMPYIGRYSRLNERLYVATGFNKWGMSSAMLSGMMLSDMMLGVKNEFSELFEPSRSMLHRRLLINIGHTVKGLFTPTAPRCTHLGCALKYNKEEHSWDCGCHGSRFTDSGEVINNPANRNLKE